MPIVATTEMKISDTVCNVFFALICSFIFHIRFFS